MSIAVFKEHSDRVVSVIFSPNNQLVASASYDDTVRLWNPQTGKVIRIFSVKSIEGNDKEKYKFLIGSSSKLSFSEDGEILTLGNGYNALISWQVATGRVINTVKGRADYTAGTTFSPDGNFFANAFSATSSNSDLVNLNIEQITQQLSRSTFLPNIGSIVIWDVKKGRQIHTISNTGLVVSMAFSFDNRILVSTNTSNDIQLWNLETKELLNQWKGLRTVAISSDGTLVAGNLPKVIKIWNFITGEEVYSLESNFNNYIQALTFSSDNEFIVSASAADNTIELWNLISSKTIAILSSPQVYSVVFSPNSKMIASANFDNTVRIWKMP